MASGLIPGLNNHKNETWALIIVDRILCYAYTDFYNYEYIV